MAEAFDPYHKWLGIPPEDQPPNHYRLLAINLFESDADVIASAADQRMVHVRTFQTGKNSALSQKVLNEISAARVCLLSPQKKAAYDRELRPLTARHTQPDRTAEPAVDSARRVVPLSAAPATPGGDIPPISTVERTPAGYAPRGKRQSWQVVAAVAIAFAFCAGIVAVLSTQRDSSTPVADNRASLPDDNPAVPDDKSPLPEEKLFPPDEEPPVPEDRPPPPNDRPPAPDEKPPAPDAKLPVPDSDARAKAEEQLKELLTGAAPERLLEAALADDCGDAERYLLLRKAGDLAAAAGDAENALRAVDELAKRYEVDVLQMKVETLVKLQNAAKAPAESEAVAEHALVLVDRAVALGKHELAKRVAIVALAAARKAEHHELTKKATLRFLEL